MQERLDEVFSLFSVPDLVYNDKSIIDRLSRVSAWEWAPDSIDLVQTAQIKRCELDLMQLHRKGRYLPR